MAEMQRAVTVAERRALESVTNERIKMERLLMEAASASGTSASISSTSSGTTNTIRNADINMLDAAINSERLDKNGKMIVDRAKQDNDDDYATLQGIRQNEDMTSGECGRAVKNKVRFR